MSFAESNGVHVPMQNFGSSSVASDGGTEPYYPLMPPTISSSSPPSPLTETYQFPSAAAASVPVPFAGDSSVVGPVGSVDIEPAKRKRGRPRKYSPPPLSAAQVAPQPPGGFSPAEGKKARGRPPGSGKKQQLANLGSAVSGVGFRPHVVPIKAGEDVFAKLMAFSQSTARAVCILSANGSISDVTLQPAALSGRTVTYEGLFQILSLSGSFLLSESGGERSRTGRLSVLLAEPDGKVLGGGVGGVLTAASSVQVIVGSFSMEVQRQLKLDHFDPLGAPFTLVSGASAAKSPSSLGTVSESSGEPGSPHNNQLVETSNNSPPVVANNLLWR